MTTLATGIYPPPHMASNSSMPQVDGHHGKITKDTKPAQYRDLWAALLFWLNTLIVIGVGIWLAVKAPGSDTTAPKPKPGDDDFVRSLLVSVGSGLGFGTIFSLIMYSLIMKFPTFIVHTAFLAFAVIYAILGVASIAFGGTFV